MSNFVASSASQDPFVVCYPDVAVGALVIHRTQRGRVEVLEAGLQCGGKCCAIGFSNDSTLVNEPHTWRESAMMRCWRPQKRSDGDRASVVGTDCILRPKPGAVECFFVEVGGEVVGLTEYHVADDGLGDGMDLVLLPGVR